MRPFMRLISAAWLIGSLDFDEAVTMTRVGADAAGAGERHFRQRLADGDVGAELLGERGARGVGVEADHAAAVGLEDLHGQQADQAEAHHDDGLAERRRRLPHALQRDGAERDEARVLVVDAGGHAHAEVLRHGVDLGVIGEPGAGAGDAVAEREAGDVAARRR